MFQLEENTAKLAELESLLPDQDTGPRPADSAKMEAALKVTGELLKRLEETAEELKGVCVGGAHTHDRHNYKHSHTRNMQTAYK